MRIPGKLRLCRWAGICAFVLFTCGLAVAQAPIGSIQGTVTDPMGAVVPGAKVTITNLATQGTVNLTTTSAGIFVARALQPGEYKVDISAKGFKDFVVPTVTVQAGGSADASAKLELGLTTQTVEVSAMPVQVDTTDATVSGVITAQQIDQMPLNARNFLELAMLQPGVQIYDGGVNDPTKSATYRSVSILGRSGTGTRTQIDGIDITDETVGMTDANISDDAVQEFQLSQSGLDLSTSLTSSGAISIISRSGGNHFHGSGFWFYRNQDMGARLGFDPNSEPFHRTQVGYRFGGPIVKDKLFFFSNWERTYQQEQGSYTTDQNFPSIDGHNCTTGCFAGVPLGIRMVDERIDWDIKPNVRTFYRFGHDWNVSTGGTIPVSPFQNKDQTIMLVAGLDTTTSRFSHSFRFGSVFFHNQIVSQSFSGFAFPTTPTGTQYNLSVGAYNLGPNGLAPQGTLQHNLQGKYDGSFTIGSHVLRFGFEYNHIKLGGFANFAGPLSFSGVFSSSDQAAVAARGADPTDPAQYPLSDFSLGPANGFFTIKPCFGYTHGCHINNRYAAYFGDTWRAKRNLTLLLGTRWEYDSGYFNNEGVSRPAFFNFWGKGIANTPTFPKDKFGPQVGFAWDPKGDGKTSIRGGFYLAYEMNIYNNLIFDENGIIPAGIGPDFYTSAGVNAPDGSPITPAVAGVTTLPAPCTTASATTALAGGDWTCLTDPSLTIGGVVPIVDKINNAVQNAYANYKFSPTSGPIQFITSRGVTFGFETGGSRFKIPYSEQFNFGVEHELKPGTVLTTDFLYNHGIGMPFLGEDLECRRCAKTLNVAAAQAKVAAVLGGMTVDQWIAAHPGKTISSFGLASDSIFQGLTPDPTSPYPETQSINFLRARIMTAGGFSKYFGLQTKLQGRLGEHSRLVHDASYLINWAWGRSDATNGAFRPEFLNNCLDKLDCRNPRYFGPVAEDRAQQISGGITWDTLGGFRLAQDFHFTTAPPMSLTVPTLTLSGSNALFSTDLIGQGGTGSTPFNTELPGVNVGQFGRSVNSWAALNKAISNYNSTVAGNLTPAGRALVSAGIFTESQLKQLGAVSPMIPLVPTTNPWPFNNYFNFDLGITRPTRIAHGDKVITVEPWLQIFNVFNYTGLGTYGGLGTTFGSLNYPYAASEIPALKSQRGRNNSTRLMQIGVRVSF